MKKILSLISLVLVVSSSIFAQEPMAHLDSLKLASIESTVLKLDSCYRLLKNDLNRTETKLKESHSNIIELRKSNKLLSLQNQDLAKQVDSLVIINNQQNAKIDDVSNTLAGKITQANETIAQSNTKLSDDIADRSMIGVIIVIIAILISMVIYFILRKQNTTSFKTLQEESVKLDNKLMEVLESQMKIQTVSPASTNTEVDHSLALKVADEIIRIETNLSRMDSSIKGYKQLSASVRRIKDNFKANGYELVEMIGKPYSEGMKVSANFVTDDNLKDGEQIISGITKPQINYNGTMIQVAQITVSQN